MTRFAATWTIGPRRRIGREQGEMTAPPPELSRGKILYLEDLTVSFDGFKALDALTLYVEPGELRCIIGPNGAGKTTMMDVITGKTRPDHGSAWFGRGHRSAGAHPSRRSRRPASAASSRSRRCSSS